LNHATTAIPPDGPAAPPDDAAVHATLTGWERLSLGAIHLALTALLRLLSLNGLYAFGRAFGTVEYLINYRRRRRFAEAMREILGHEPTPAERRRETREFFSRSRCDRMFYLVLDCLSPERAERLFTITNRELLDECLARGRGAYIALSHNGPHHVAAALFAMCGYRIAGVRDRREGALRRYIQARLDRQGRTRHRMRVLYADSFPRQIYRCFEDGYVVGSAIDIGRVRDPKQRYETVPLFGRAQPFLTGPLRIALRCKAPVIEGLLVPEPGFRYRFEVRGLLIDPNNPGNEDEAVRGGIERFARTIEAHLRQHPHQVSRV
jgi:lauroyl/myristoyl acyltransferase